MCNVTVVLVYVLLRDNITRLVELEISMKPFRDVCRGAGKNKLEFRHCMSQYQALRALEGMRQPREGWQGKN